MSQGVNVFSLASAITSLTRQYGNRFCDTEKFNEFIRALTLAESLSTTAN